jgi:hypothetical protein
VKVFIKVDEIVAAPCAKITRRMDKQPISIYSPPVVVLIAAIASPNRWFCSSEKHPECQDQPCSHAASLLVRVRLGAIQIRSYIEHSEQSDLLGWEVLE